MWETLLSASKCVVLTTSALFVCVLAACAQETPADFLGFQPLSFERVASRSHDESIILHFEDPSAVPRQQEACEDTPKDDDEDLHDDDVEKADEAEGEDDNSYKTLFYRKFHGKYAATRCRYFSTILDALSVTGAAPYPVRVGSTEIVVTFVEGESVTLEHFESETFLPLVMATLNRFYKALEPVQDSLPERALLHLAETRVNKIKDKATKEFLRNLLQKWRRKFWRDLEDTARVVVHGDLHANNMIVNDGRLWLLDYGLCGKGFLIEDLARLSVFSQLSYEDECYMLRHWFEDKYGEELYKLFDACKRLAVFVWFLIEAQRLSAEDVRGAIFTIDVGGFNEVAFARGVADVHRPPLYRVKKLLGQSARRLKELFGT